MTQYSHCKCGATLGFDGLSDGMCRDCQREQARDNCAECGGHGGEWVTVYDDDGQEYEDYVPCTNCGN